MGLVGGFVFVYIFLSGNILTTHKSPLLLLIPGLDGTGRLFAPLLKEIPASVKTLVVQYPDDESANLDEIVAFIRRQIPDVPLVVVTESFAGPIAIKLLATGLAAKACVFCATFAKSPRKLLLNLLRLLPVGLLLKYPLPKVLIKRLMLVNPVPSATLELVQQTIHSLPPRGILRRLQILRTLDVAALLPQLPNITYLFIQPTNDRLVPANSVNVFIEHLQNLTCRQVPGGHFILQANPGECWLLIATLFNKK